jgi:hypothetical protein
MRLYQSAQCLGNDSLREENKLFKKYRFDLMQGHLNTVTSTFVSEIAYQI